MQSGQKLKRFLTSSACLFLTAVILSSCSPGVTSSPSPSTSPTPSASAPETASPSPSDTGVVYHNSDYGFDFNLPDDWAGYTIVTESWNGTPLTDGGQTETGPQILIRSPKWTSGTPTFDIPIMVFTLAQWEGVQNEKFAVSAAPVPPAELGRNAAYVFALPPRYDFYELPGRDIVVNIISTNPLHPTENIGVSPPPPETSADGHSAIVYKNTTYGFDFNLPTTWEGYSIVTQEWNGTPLTEGGQPQKGPEILIRNPKWTSESPMQDIPIMVFTIDQWDALQREEFSVSAAPIGPSELGRNNKYVFALPARYNYAFLPGYEEVEDIMNSKPLHAFDI